MRELSACCCGLSFTSDHLLSMGPSAKMEVLAEEEAACITEAS